MRIAYLQRNTYLTKVSNARTSQHEELSQPMVDFSTCGTNELPFIVSLRIDLAFSVLVEFKRLF
jgi:hypothetical protein